MATVVPRGSGLAGHERRWPATLTVVVVLALQLALPSQVTWGPGWLFVGLEAALLVPVAWANPVRLARDTPVLRSVALVLTAVVALANAGNLARLIAVLLSGVTVAPLVLVKAALLLWVTNLAASALGLWELDRGGPFARDPRHARSEGRPDLLFPQMSGVPGWDARAWRPAFSDYLFVAFTAATAFSPTDTMPLSARAKLVFALNATVSLLTLALVAARAVNIL